jgi:two-component sensor histidine kinase
MKTFRLLAGLLLCGLAGAGQPPPAWDALAAQLASSPEYEKFRAVRLDWQVAQSRNEPRFWGDVYYRLGKLYRGIGDYHRGHFWFLQAARRWEPLGPSKDLARLHVQLSGLFVLLHRPLEACEHAHRSLAVAQRVRSADSTHCLMSAFTHLANVHSTFVGTAHNAGGRFSLDSSYRYYRLAEQQAKLLGEPDELPGIRHSLAKYWYRRDDRRVVPYLKAALDGYGQIGAHRSVVLCKIDFALVSLRLNDVTAARHLLASARRDYDHNHLEDPSILADLDLNYARFYRRTGQYRLADLHQRRADEWRFTTLNADRDAAVARLSLEYETEKRDARIASQQRELSLRAAALRAERRVNYAMAGMLAAAMMASVIFFRLNRKNRRISRQNAELVAEQSHRVKNHLQAAQNLLGLQAIRLTDQTARRAVAESQLRVQAIGLLHGQLYQRPESLTKVALDAYIADVTRHILDAYGLGHLQPDYHLTPALLPADSVLPLGLILNELVTNACKYAFPDHPSPRLAVITERRAEALRLIVHDNGPGFCPLSKSAATYGLRLIQVQVEQLQGCHAFFNQNGCRFELTFPLKTHEHANAHPAAG